MGETNVAAAAPALKPVSPRSALGQLIKGPASDYMRALDVCLRDKPRVSAALLACSAALSWWLYVPLHELLHAAGCLVTGGEVTELEIQAMYGAHALQKIFPFVTVGSSYAGRLSGFETHGSDLVYFATDLAPFLLTIFMGIPLIHFVAQRRPEGARGPILLGLALPSAIAPVISVIGDYYEMGSIVVSRVAHAFDPSHDLTRFRGDDVELVVKRVSESGLERSDVIGLSASFATGVLLIALTFAVGQWFARTVVGVQTSKRADA